MTRRRRDPLGIPPWPDRMWAVRGPAGPLLSRTVKTRSEWLVVLASPAEAIRLAARMGPGHGPGEISYAEAREMVLLRDGAEGLMLVNADGGERGRLHLR